MDRFDRQGVADRAGVDLAFVDRLVALGILRPGAGDEFTIGDVQRAGVAEGLERGGLSLDEIGAAMRRGDLTLDFVDQPSFIRFAGVGAETFADVSTRTGIPVDLLMAIREAMGFAQPSPEDRVRDDELQVVPLIELQLREGFRTAVVERWLRVYGESLRRVAQTEADWFRSELLEPLYAAGKGPADIGELTGRLDVDLARFSDQAVLGLFHGNEAHAWMKNIFEGFEATMTASGVHTPLDRPPAICFLDLTGYTRLTEERGDAAAADLAARLAQLVQRTAGQHGGRAVKWLGDGVMFHFREPGPGVLAALEMVEEASVAELPPPMSASTRDRCCSRRGTTSGEPSTPPPGSPTTRARARCWSARRSSTRPTARRSRSPRSVRSSSRGSPGRCASTSPVARRPRRRPRARM